MTAVADFKSLAAAFAAAWAARFGDVEKDAVLLEDVALVLADLGVPDAALAAQVLGVIATLIPLAKAGGVFSGAGLFAPAPWPGPPLTQADWSRGFPKPEPVANPSGAIGDG